MILIWIAVVIKWITALWVAMAYLAELGIVKNLLAAALILLTSGGFAFRKDYEKYLGKKLTVIFLILVTLTTLGSIFGFSIKDITDKTAGYIFAERQVKPPRSATGEPALPSTPSAPKPEEPAIPERRSPPVLPPGPEPALPSTPSAPKPEEPAIPERRSPPMLPPAPEPALPSTPSAPKPEQPAAPERRSPPALSPLSLSLLQTFAYDKAVVGIAFSPDSHTLALAGNGAVTLRDVTTGNVFRTIQAEPREIIFSPDGRKLAAIVPGSKEGFPVDVWDAGTGRILHKLMHPPLSPPASIAFSPDSRMLASAEGQFRRIVLWDMATGKALRTFTSQQDVAFDIVFSPLGRLLAATTWRHTINLWDISSGQVARTLTGHVYDVSAVAFSPDGQTLASGSDDKTIKLWDVTTGQVIRTLTGHAFRIWSVAFSPDGRILASTSEETLKLWDVSTGQVLRTLPAAGLVRDVAFSPDGHMLAATVSDSTYTMWNVQLWNIKWQ